LSSQKGAAPSGDPEIGGEVTGFAQKYPSTGDAYLDGTFYGHALGVEARALRVTSMRQTGQGKAGGVATSTTARYDGVLRSLSSLSPGSASTFEFLSAEGAFSFLGFKIGTEMTYEAELRRATITNTSGSGTQVQPIELGFKQTIKVLQVGFGSSGRYVSPSFSISPAQVNQELFQARLAVDVTPSTLRSYIDLSAKYKLRMGVGGSVSAGPFGFGSSYTYYDFLEYELSSTRYYLLR
jgi:hypothetical protein